MAFSKIIGLGAGSLARPRPEADPRGSSTTARIIARIFRGDAVMRFSIKSSPAQALRSDCVIVPVLTGRKLTAAGKLVDDALAGALTAALGRADLGTKAGSTQLVYADSGKGSRALLVSMGSDAKVSQKSFSEAVRGAMRHAGTLAKGDASSLLHDAEVDSRDLAWRISTQVAIARELAYRFDGLKSKKDDQQQQRLDQLAFLVEQAQAAPSRRTAARAEAISHGIGLAKDLGNTPSNICTPRIWRRGAKDGRRVQAQGRGARTAPDGAAGHGVVAVGRAGLAPAAQAHRAPVRGRRGEQARGAGRQGRHLRHRRHLAQAGRRDGRDEVRHVRRGERARHDAGRRRR